MDSNALGDSAKTRSVSWFSFCVCILLAACINPAYSAGKLLSFECVITEPKGYSGIEIGYVIDTETHQVLSDLGRRTGRVSVSNLAVSWKSRNAAGYSSTVVDLKNGDLVISSLVGELFHGNCGVVTLDDYDRERQESASIQRQLVIGTSEGD